ncbi:MAG: hypothetical protein ABIS17_10365 [Casimicrobiaceae bacterium]
MADCFDLTFKSPEGLAEVIANRVRRTITEHLDEGPRVLRAILQAEPHMLPPSQKWRPTGAVAIDDIVRAKRKVDWTLDVDVHNQMKIAIEDELFRIKDAHHLKLARILAAAWARRTGMGALEAKTGRGW